MRVGCRAVVAENARICQGSTAAASRGLARSQLARSAPTQDQLNALDLHDVKEQEIDRLYNKLLSNSKRLITGNRRTARLMTTSTRKIAC
jgi:hypothetical protein